jgi:CBS domain-containing protein
MLKIEQVLAAETPKLQIPVGREAAIAALLESGLPALPMVDAQGSYIGGLTAEALLRNPEEEQIGVLVSNDQTELLTAQLGSAQINTLRQRGYIFVSDGAGKLCGAIYTRDVLKKVLARKEFERVPITPNITRNFPLIWGKTPSNIAWRSLGFLEQNDAIITDDSMSNFSTVSAVNLLRAITEEKISVREEAGAAGAEEEWGVEGTQIIYMDKLVLMLSPKPIEVFASAVRRHILLSDSVATVAAKMCMENARLLPVINSDRALVGAVAANDLLDLVITSSPESLQPPD